MGKLLYSLNGFLVLLLCVSLQSRSQSMQSIEKGFLIIPDSVQTSAYWYWVSGHISEEGAIKDLEAMKAVGINRAFIGNVDIEGTPPGKVIMFSDEWWKVLHTALKTATQLGIEIGLFNAPGWSQSGGPWVKPNQAMRYLASSDTIITGSRKVSIRLPRPSGNFEDYKVLAYKVPADFGRTFASYKPAIHTSPQIAGAANMVDGKTDTWTSLANKSIITLTLPNHFDAQAISIKPSPQSVKMDLTLEALTDTGYQFIKTFEVNRLNNRLNVGFEQFAPVIETFAPTSAKVFRLTVSNIEHGASIAEIELSAFPLVERFKEKSLARMHPTPLAYWHDYRWPSPQEPGSKKGVVPAKAVLDITDKLNKDGLLTWKVPKGNWVILRTGMKPTDVVNSPVPAVGTGLEVDKMDSRHVRAHFDAYLGEIIRRIPAADRRCWKIVVLDSYETGGQNWTDDLTKMFTSAYGYSPIPYIPVLYGQVVESQDKSDRFLWDLRRLVADKIAYEYVAGLRDISHKHGLTTWLENYGHWGFPGEFLQYGGQSDEIGGEFWSEGELGDIENRAASSAAHIYGKTKVSSESFTSSGNTFGRYPAMLRKRADRFFAEGINNSLLHVYIHQPYEGKLPGVNAWFGTELNRHNTWFSQSGSFIEYLKRSNFLLQQGKYVADVAYFIGEDAPKMTGVQSPSLPKGYSFDYINGEVIRDRLSVRDGKFILPDGMQYRILVLPALETIRPELLETIEQLVKEGGTVLGPRPKRSPSLSNYPHADDKVNEIADRLWHKIDGKENHLNKYGKGIVMDGISLEQAFKLMDVMPDCLIEGDEEALFLHRKHAEGDIYFITNQKDHKINIAASFRISGRSPELWDAASKVIRPLPVFYTSKGVTSVPLELEAHESVFIVFREQAAGGWPASAISNFPKASSELLIGDSWKVQFDTAFNGPSGFHSFDKLTDWAKHPNKEIAHYSGTASYYKDFELTENQASAKLWLDLGNVIAIASVKINGQDAGSVWTAPYKLDVSKFVRKGTNTIEVFVTNTWVNRLIGDSKMSASQRKTWTFVNPYTPESELHSSGLLGPVRLLFYE